MPKSCTTFSFFFSIPICEDKAISIGILFQLASKRESRIFPSPISTDAFEYRRESSFHYYDDLCLTLGYRLNFNCDHSRVYSTLFHRDLMTVWCLIDALIVSIFIMTFVVIVVLVNKLILHDFNQYLRNF